MYSQDLSNRKTLQATIEESGQFLYSQDLSNRKTAVLEIAQIHLFLYSQDLSNFCIYYLKSFERDFMTPKIFFGEWYEDEKTDSAFIEVTGISSVIVDMKVFLIASNQ